MKAVMDKLELAFAAVGGVVGWFLGGFDGFLYALIVFVVMDLPSPLWFIPHLSIRSTGSMIPGLTLPWTAISPITVIPRIISMGTIWWKRKHAEERHKAAGSCGSIYAWRTQGKGEKA